MRRLLVLAIASCFASEAVFSREAFGVQLIASSTFDGLIYHIDDAGNATILPSGLGPESLPHGVAVDAERNVFVAVTGGSPDQIRRIRPNGENDIFYAFDSPFDNPEGLAVGPDGNLYVAGAIDFPTDHTPNAVYQITPDGLGGPFSTAGGESNLGLTVDRSGNVYVTDQWWEVEYFWGEVWRITPDGDSERLARFHARPFAIAIAPDGESLLVADQKGDRILNVSLAGDVGLFANIFSPLSLAVDCDGNVFVGQLDQISRIAPDGTQSVIATGFREVRGLAIYPVPEPGTLLLVAMVGFAALPLRRR